MHKKTKAKADVLDWSHAMKIESEHNIFKALKEFSMLPSKHLQDKIDYFITPYNATLSMQKHMDFEDEYEK